MTMGGEEVSGPAGPKVARLLYFVGAGFITALAINKWREWERNSLNQQQQRQQPQLLNNQSRNHLPNSVQKSTDQ